ncbi:MAG: 3-keto-5-aminohexanoate cleavage protein, partial [Gemmatimonadetes bacterium]|nr:3-keto-5-aminohexanoate cleavage protein [Gemmatimonadota bacterium]
GVLLKSNAQMVDLAASIVEKLQGEIATPNDAREMLGLTYPG